MLQQEWYGIAVQLFWYGGWIVAALVFGILHGKRDDNEEDDRQDLDSRRKQGGRYWNDLLWDIKGSIGRTRQRMLDLMVEEKPALDRRELRDIINECDNNLERIERLLHMRSDD